MMVANERGGMSRKNSRNSRSMGSRSGRSWRKEDEGTGGRQHRTLSDREQTHARHIYFEPHV
eukprot:2365434-Pyramimonas_sp.AAC.1